MNRAGVHDKPERARRLVAAAVLTRVLCAAARAGCGAALMSAAMPGATAMAQQAAGEVQVGIDVRPGRVFLGDAATLEITIAGASGVDPPTIEVPGAVVQYLGPQNRSSTSSVFSGGRWNTRTEVVTGLLYSLRPTRAGELTIPPITVTVNGQTFTTPARTVTVAEPTVSTDVALAMEVENTRAYVGEPVRVRVVWTLAREIRGYALTMPQPENADLVDGPDPRAPGTSPIDPRYIEIKIGDATTIATLGNREINGRTVRTVTIERVLIPKAPGTITLGPVRADFNVVVGQRQRTMMDSVFDDLSVLERQTASAPAVKVEARALPSEGRPADFSGLVGAYSVEASAAQSIASVGDPIDLTVKVNGPFPLSLVPPLDLRRQALAKAFRTPRDPVLPETDATSAVFRAQVRARSTAGDVIPPIELSYFDTASGTYRVARSQPIAMKIRASEAADLGALGALEDEDAAAAAKPDDAPTPTAERVGGLAPIDRRAPLVTPMLGVLDAQPERALRLGLFGVGLLGVAGIAVRAARWAAERNPERARRRLAYRLFRRELGRAARSAAPEHGVARAICDYAARLTSQPAGRLAGPEATPILRRRDETVGVEIERLLARLDAVTFGGHRGTAERAGESDRLAREAMALIARIHAGAEREGP